MSQKTKDWIFMIVTISAIMLAIRIGLNYLQHG